MATTERLFLYIFNTKRRIERQLHQQFKSYGESLACNIIADGRRPPPWLLGLASVSEILIDPGGKKNIKAKALKAAEAAKRIEDQKKLEREKRKAAVKLEREKLRQENTKLLKLKQKQKAEVGRKKENIAARKRQREANNNNNKALILRE